MAGAEKFAIQKFELLPGEEILYQSKPKKIMYWIMVFGGLFAIMFFARIPMQLFLQGTNFWIVFIVCAIISFVISYSFAKQSYNNRIYWITDRRIIHKLYFYGAVKFYAIPWEQIEDIEIVELGVRVEEKLFDKLIQNICVQIITKESQDKKYPFILPGISVELFGKLISKYIQKKKNQSNLIE